MSVICFLINNGTCVKEKKNNLKVALFERTVKGSAFFPRMILPLSYLPNNPFFLKRSSYHRISLYSFVGLKSPCFEICIFPNPLRVVRTNVSLFFLSGNRHVYKQNKENCITRFGIYHNNVMSPPVKRMIHSVYIDVSPATSHNVAWIVTTFASYVHVHELYCRGKRMRYELASGVFYERDLRSHYSLALLILRHKLFSFQLVFLIVLFTS